MRDFSVSSINKYNKCAALYDLEYNHGLKDESSDRRAMDRGTCVHAGIENYLVTGSTDKAEDAAKRCEGEIDPDIRSEAGDIVRFYVPYLQGIKPLFHEGRRLLEFEFQRSFSKYGVGLKGRIDAVVQMPDGSTAMIDWKCRADGSKFYRDWPLQVDRQLLVYAAVLKHGYGIEVDHIYQVQLSAALPDVPKVYKGKKPTKIENFQKTMGATTHKVLHEALSLIEDPSIRSSLLMQHFERVRDEEYFIKFSEVDGSTMDRALHLTLLTAKRMSEDKEYLPILDAYICKFCPYIRECRRIKLGANV